MTMTTPEPKCAREGCGLPLASIVHAPYTYGFDSVPTCHPFEPPKETAEPAKVGLDGDERELIPCSCGGEAFLSYDFKSGRAYSWIGCETVTCHVTAQSTETTALVDFWNARRTPEPARAGIDVEKAKWQIAEPIARRLRLSAVDYHEVEQIIAAELREIMEGR